MGVEPILAVEVEGRLHRVTVTAWLGSGPPDIKYVREPMAADVEAYYREHLSRYVRHLPLRR